MLLYWKWIAYYILMSSIERCERFNIIRNEVAMKGWMRFFIKIRVKLKTRIFDQIGLHQRNHQSPVSSADNLVSCLVLTRLSLQDNWSQESWMYRHILWRVLILLWFSWTSIGVILDFRLLLDVWCTMRISLHLVESLLVGVAQTFYYSESCGCGEWMDKTCDETVLNG